MAIFASAARSILEVSQRALAPIFTCCYSTVASGGSPASGNHTTPHPVEERHTRWRSATAGSQVVLSGRTAAAQHGLYLSVTHKPFRAATASPEPLGTEALRLLASERRRQTFSGGRRHLFRLLCIDLTLLGGCGVRHLKQSKPHARGERCSVSRTARRGENSAHSDPGSVENDHLHTAD